MEPNDTCWMVVHFAGEYFGGAALILQHSGAVLETEVLTGGGYDLCDHDMPDNQWPSHKLRDGLWLWRGTCEPRDGKLQYTGVWSRLTAEQLAWLSDGRCVAD